MRDVFYLFSSCSFSSCCDVVERCKMFWEVCGDAAILGRPAGASRASGYSSPETTPQRARGLSHPFVPVKMGLVAFVVPRPARSHQRLGLRLWGFAGIHSIIRSVWLPCSATLSPGQNGAWGLELSVTWLSTESRRDSDSSFESADAVLSMFASRMRLGMNNRIGIVGMFRCYRLWLI